MNFNINQISHLIGKIKNQEIKAVLLCGPDNSLISQIANNLSKKLSMELEEVNFNEISYSNALRVALNKQDFFLSKKLIKIINLPDEISENFKADILNDNLHPSVIIGKNFKSTSKIKQFFEKQNSLGLVICSGLTEYQVKKIIQTRIKEAGKIINPDALEYLYNSIQDYQLLLKEVEKLLCCYIQENVITLDMVKSVVSSQYNLIDTQILTFHLLLNQKLEYLKLISTIDEKSESLIFYIRGILHNVMQIYCVSAELKNNLNSNVRQIIRKKKIFVSFKHLDQFISVVETVNFRTLVKLMNKLQKLEILLKTDSRKISYLEILADYVKKNKDALF